MNFKVQSLKFGDFAKVIPGYAFKGADFGDTGIAVVKIAEISPPRVELSACQKIAAEKTAGLDKFRLKKGDIVMAMTGATIGKTGRMVDDEIAYLNQRVAKIENIQGVSDKDYIYYLVTSKENNERIVQLGLGSAQPNFSGRDLESLEFNVPALSIQQTITGILKPLDDKIELNRQTNHTLEKIVSTLFQEICVPPSEELPEGWQLLKLGGFIELKNGYAFKGTDFIEEGIPVLKIKNVKAGKVILHNLSYVSREVADRTQRFRIKQNDLLITMSGNRIDGTPETWVGKAGIFHRDGEYLLNQRVSILNIIDENRMSRYFLSQLLSTEEFQYYFISNATSSGGQANISPDLVCNTEIRVPPIEALRKFDNLARDIYNKIFANELEVETLASLRDNLLPKLLKGEKLKADQ